ncbi:MAG: DUF2807 domain-containing protein [Bacteroidales bacterium]|nr:DUF2807 domain-containing protein [Bacteroidales bacterium]
MKYKTMACLIGITLLTTGVSFAQSSKIDVKDFNGVINCTPANVNITQATNYKVEVIAPQSVVAILDIGVDNGNLVIKTKDKHYRWTNTDSKITINIEVPTLNQLSINGSGNIMAKSAITTEHLVVKINGSGNLKIESLETTSLTVKSNGSGDVSIAGTKPVENAEFGINGSGDIETDKLACKKLTSHTNGSGDIEAWVTDDLNAKILGSGDVSIKGNPTINAKVLGSGRVRRD